MVLLLGIPESPWAGKPVAPKLSLALLNAVYMNLPLLVVPTASNPICGFFLPLFHSHHANHGFPASLFLRIPPAVSLPLSHLCPTILWSSCFPLTPHLTVKPRNSQADVPPYMSNRPTVLKRQWTPGTDPMYYLPGAEVCIPGLRTNNMAKTIIRLGLTFLLSFSII